MDENVIRFVPLLVHIFTTFSYSCRFFSSMGLERKYRHSHSQASRVQSHDETSNGKNMWRQICVCDDESRVGVKKFSVLL